VSGVVSGVAGGADVAVVIAARDAAATIGAALDSIARAVDRAAPCSVEVVVVDGSTDADGGATRARCMARPDVRWVAQDGTGLAAARNQGLALASAPLVAFCDADDTWTPDALRLRRDALVDAPDAWAATGRVRFVAVAGGRAAGRVTGHVEGGAVRRRDGDEHDGATPGALLVRRDAMGRVGPFDTTLTVGADADWIVRAERRYGPAVAVEAVVLEKGLRAGSLSTDVVTYRQELLTVARRFLADRTAREPGRREPG
jgi:glycosyltransferase involved in cell wall biosynthesis